jgi:PPE-repeat protein
MVDFGALPPEINSARMYSGPGSSSLQAAASAWNGLAAELQSAANGYDTVITQLASDEWMGPASASMASAAQPYVSWMSSTAAQAEQAATQATAAAAAYEQALQATVPPPLVAANRAETTAYTQANVFGQYTPIIAQLEAQYGEMWAQDAAAMYGYAGQSAAAANVTPFAAPAATTNPAGQAAQSAAVTQAAGAATSTSSQSLLSQLQSQLTSSLQSLTTPAATTTTYPGLTELWYLFSGQTVLPTNLGSVLNAYSPYSAVYYNTEGLPYFSVGMANFGVQIAKSTGMLGGAAPAAASLGGDALKGAAAAGKGLGGLGGGLGGGIAHTSGAVSADLGNASSIGRLAVPASWAGAAPPVTPQAAVPVSSVSAVPEQGAGGNLLGGMPLAGAGTGRLGAAGPRYGFKPTVMSRPPFAG